VLRNSYIPSFYIPWKNLRRRAERGDSERARQRESLRGRERGERSRLLQCKANKHYPALPASRDLAALARCGDETVVMSALASLLKLYKSHVRREETFGDEDKSPSADGSQRRPPLRRIPRRNASLN
jgi:hypothetical protein